MPTTFFCLECRLGRDAHFETLRTGYPMIYQVALAKYRELCLFRRSIKSTQEYRPRVFVDFKKVLGCEPGLANQMWKRLQSEGFIAKASELCEELNLKPLKKSKRTTASTKPNFEIVPQAFHGKQMEMYFSPQSAIESQLIGLQKDRSKGKTEENLVVSDSHHSTPLNAVFSEKIR